MSDREWSNVEEEGLSMMSIHAQARTLHPWDALWDLRHVPFWLCATIVYVNMAGKKIFFVTRKFGARILPWKRLEKSLLEALHRNNEYTKHIWIPDVWAAVCVICTVVLAVIPRNHQE